jgi:hypothetical protein
MFPGRIHAALLDNSMNRKKPFMNHYFFATGHGAGEGVKPTLTRPPITGNLTYTAKQNVGMPGAQVGINVALPNREPQQVRRFNAMEGKMRDYQANMLGRQNLAGTSPVEEQGRSPM